MFLYQDRSHSAEVRTRDLLRRMTAEEKIGQLCKLDGFRSYTKIDGRYVINQTFKDTVLRCPIGSMYGLIRADWWTQKDWDSGIPPERMNEAVNLFQKYILENSRLGIPLYIAEEAPHGLMALGATVFPTGLGLGGAWDADLIRRVGRIIGREARAAGVQTVYAPLLDIPRDPRWSRAEENFSEDPYLTSILGREMTKGIMEEDIVVTLKHFAAHGSPEGGHNTWPSHVGPIELRNCQLRPFREAIKAGAKSLMSAYSDVDGEPSSGSYHLLTEVLRHELGFDGFVVADRGAIPRLVWSRIAADDAEASATALKAGCDVDEGCLEMHSSGLREALRRGLITEEDLDVAAGRILKVKFEIGLFDQPYAESRPAEICGHRKHQEVALEASRKAMTLLKNDGILPLKNIRSLAVIGPNADHVMNQLGDYTAPQRREDVTTVLDGIRKIALEEHIAVSYASGCRIRKIDYSGFADAVKLAEQTDATVLVLGGSSTKYGSNMARSETGAAVVSEILDNDESDKESGEGTDRATLNLSGVQLELFDALRKTGKPVIVVLVQGRPLLVNEFMDHAAAVLLAWYPGNRGGQAIAEVLFGRYNPAGRLPISIPYSEGQLPVFYNAVPNPRPRYVDGPGEARLKFGYGLSYTTFTYSELKISGRRAAVTVTNTGALPGEEVVQFYLTDLASSVLRPYRELCAFERIMLQPGESRRLEIELTNEMLGYYDHKLRFVVEPGKFKLAVGGNLDQLLEDEFELITENEK